MIMDSTKCATYNDKTLQILTLKFWIDTNVIFIPSFLKQKVFGFENYLRI